MPRRPKSLPPKLTNFCATINNYSENRCKKLRKLVDRKVLSYIIIGYEVGNEGYGTPHLQIYGQSYAKEIRTTTLKKELGNKAHIEQAFGTYKHNRRYCGKDLFWEEFGIARTEKSQTQGKSKANLMQFRLQKIADLAKGGATFKQLVAEDILVAAKYTKFCDRMSLYYKPEPRQNLQVELHYGLPGAGKTFDWFDRYPDTYELPIKTGKNEPLWWDGYDGEKEVLLDDFSGKIALDDFLRLIDKYRVKVPIKGSFVNFVPDRICITTNVHYDEWYNYSKRQSSKQAMLRRITKFFYHKKEGNLFIQEETDVNFIAKQRDHCFDDQQIPHSTISDPSPDEMNEALQLAYTDNWESTSTLVPYISEDPRSQITLLSDSESEDGAQDFQTHLESIPNTTINQFAKPIAPLFDLVKQFSVDNFKYYKKK